MPKFFLDESALSPPILRGGATESHAISSILKEMPPAVRKEMRTSTAAYLTGESGHFEALNPTTGLRVTLDYPHQARDDAILAEFEVAYQRWVHDPLKRYSLSQLVQGEMESLLARHGVMSPQQRVRIMGRIKRRSEELRIAGTRGDAEEEGVRKIAADYAAWVGTEYFLGKPDGSGLHKLAEELLAGRVRVPDHDGQGRSTLAKALEKSSLPDCHSVVIEHDWAGAFRKAEDLSGEWEPPYPACAFEFGINGRRVIMLFEKDEGASSASGAVFIHLPLCWVMLTGFDLIGDEIKVAARYSDAAIILELIKLCVAQARFASIALDAKVAETEVVRAPHRLNRAREKAGKLPLYDYHVVNLARRSRPSRLEPIEGGLEAERRNSPRLHFRRQHWRYFANHRTRIPWTLVGDPDLGFIEKHYRL